MEKSNTELTRGVNITHSVMDICSCSAGLWPLRLINNECLLLFRIPIHLFEQQQEDREIDRERESELKGKERDWEIHKETALGDWMTKIFACSRTASNPSLSFLQLYLALWKSRRWETRGKKVYGWLKGRACSCIHKHTQLISPVFMPSIDMPN